MVVSEPLEADKNITMRSTNEMKELLVQGVEGLVPWLSEDDLFYLKYTIGNNFVDDGVRFLLELIEQSDLGNKLQDRALGELKKHGERLKAEEERLLSIRLTDDQVLACVQVFLGKYEISADVDGDSIIYTKDYQDTKNYPVWTVKARLLPPASTQSRKVCLVVGARSQGVILMVTDRE